MQGTNTTCAAPARETIGQAHSALRHKEEPCALGVGCVGVKPLFTGYEPKACNNDPTTWLDSACLVETSRSQLFKMHLAIQRCQASEQQTRYPSKQVKGQS